MKKTLVLLILLTLAGQNLSAQAPLKIEVSTNYSLYYNHTFGLQIKAIKTITAFNTHKLNLGLATSFHIAAVPDTEARFENFSGYHHYQYHVVSLGKSWPLFNRSRWSIETAGQIGYGALQTEGRLRNTRYGIDEKYSERYNELAAGFQVSPAFRIGQSSQLIINLNVFFTELPDFIGIGYRRAL